MKKLNLHRLHQLHLGELSSRQRAIRNTLLAVEKTIGLVRVSDQDKIVVVAKHQLHITEAISRKLIEEGWWFKKEGNKLVLETKKIFIYNLDKILFASEFQLRHSGILDRGVFEFDYFQKHNIICDPETFHESIQQKLINKG